MITASIGTTTQTHKSDYSNQPHQLLHHASQQATDLNHTILRDSQTYHHDMRRALHRAARPLTQSPKQEAGVVEHTAGDDAADEQRPTT